jgi:pimeloyl-ACP methyl ester carboxylesterase
MKRSALLGILFACGVAQTFAQSNPTYIPFPGAAKGALYKPDSGPAPHVAVLLIHRTSNFLNHLGTSELPKRGFMVLAMNPRSDNNESIVNFEDNALDIKAGVEFLRKQPGITKIVLFGHSGGGPATTFYQTVAENGTSVCKDPNKIWQCKDNLAGMPKADGIVLMDAHPSNAVNGLRHMNGAVMNEDPRQIDPALDPFSTKNGFDPDGPSHYSDDFRKRYFKAQSDRMNKLIATAKMKLQKITAGQGAYPDDDVFVIPRGEDARLVELDPTIEINTLKPQKLVKNDGSIVTEIVKSTRVPTPNLQEENASFRVGAKLLTVKSFLSANAIRSTDSMTGVEWCSSNTSTDCNLQRISVPVLITAMGGHVFIRDSEIHYDMAGSKDKDFVTIEGATHGGTPCKPCEKSPGQYSNSVKNFFDYVGKWINARY